MYITRIAKIVMVACLAVFCLLVVFGNLTDYQSNYLFVKHVMSMDTTYPGNKLMYRHRCPELWKASLRSSSPAKRLRTVVPRGGHPPVPGASAPGAEFNGAKGWTIAGGLVAFLVWFLGFMVVAGEWFAMWQSATWNGQSAAFRFYLTALAVLIFVNQPDGDLAQARAEDAQKET